MTTLNDRLTSTVQKGFYRHTSIKGYIKFTSFGSQACRAEIYSPEGDIVRTTRLNSDGLEDRESYEFVPEEELPEKLRSEKSQLEVAAQTQEE